MHAGAGVVHDRAVRARPRRVHELGRDRARHRRRTCGRCATRATTRRWSARRTCTATSHARRATSTTSRRGSQRSGFAEVHETGDKFAGATPNRYTDASRRARACSTRTGGTSRTAATRARTRAARTRRSGCRCGTRRRCRCRSTPTSTRGTATRRVRWIEAYARRRAVLPVRRLPGSARPVGRAARSGRPLPRRRGRRCPATTRRPDIEGTGRYGRLLNAFLCLSDTDDDDRRRDPRHAPRVQRRRLA